MGAFAYCFKCAVLVRDKDFERGKAVRMGDRVACAACAKASGIAVPPPSAKPANSTVRTPKPAVDSSRRMPVAPPPAPPEEEDAPPPSRRGPLLGVLAGGAVVVLGLGLWFLRRPEAPSAPPPPPVREETKDVTERRAAAPVSASPKEEAARKALDAALALGKEKPADFPARLRSLQDVVWEYDGSPAAADAKKQIEAVRAEFAALAAGQFKELDAALAALFEKEQFGPALDRLDADAKRHDLPEWTRAVADRQQDVRARASKRLEELRAEAIDRRGKGQEPEVEKIVARVEAWGMPSLIARLKADLDNVARPETPQPPGALAAVPVPVEKARSVEGKAYLDGWKAAAAKSASGLADAALSELRKAASGLTEDDVKKEAAADAEDFAKAAALRQSVRERLAKLPRLRPLSVDVRTADGVKRVSGVVIQADADRAELSTGWLWWDEGTLASLAGAVRLPTDDARTLALAALLEGEAEAAKAFLGEKLDVVGAKYWAWAAEARGKVARPAADELEARGLFQSAEKEFKSVDTRVAAIGKYRTLQKDFASTSVSRVASARIAERAEAGKEYFLSGTDLAAEGTIRRGKDGKLVSTADSAPEEAIGNYVEFAFAALPGQAYRCWVQIGGCCKENFNFYLQASEMTVSVKGKKQGIDPGSAYADTIVPYVANLKKTHAEHAKGAPKGAVRWEWIQIQLPKYAEPGAKRIRLMTDQQGFGVAAAIVSASRTAPPKPAELADLEKAKAATAAAAPLDPDLAGYWSFDEKDGDGEDLSGNGRTARLLGAKRGPGKLGGGIVCAGNQDRAEVGPDQAPSMQGDYTVALWFRKEKEAEDWVRMAGMGIGTTRLFGLWEFPKDDNRIKFQISAGGKWYDIDSTRTVAAAEWAHVAATMKGKRGTLYVNGAKDGEKDLDFDPPKDKMPLSFGWYDGHAGLFGGLDEIRIYARALSDAEIRALYDAGR